MKSRGTIAVILVVAGLVLAGSWFAWNRSHSSAAALQTTLHTNALAAAHPGANPVPGIRGPAGVLPGERGQKAPIPGPGPIRRGTNPLAGRVPPGKTSATNAAPAASEGLRGRIAANWESLRASNYFYFVIIGIPLCLGAVFLALSAKSKPKDEAAGVAGAPSRPSVAGGRKSVNSCTVLQIGPVSRHLWQFAVRSEGCVLNREQTTGPGQPLPSGMVAKTWRNLFQPRLNVAWLPPEQVFLRVAQFPRSDFRETLSMVELQLEKLSPIPVGQIVWSIQILPHPSGNQQTVVLLIVARNVVEEFLGQLEGQGYLADRLEMPVLDQIQATVVHGDGVWIYPSTPATTQAIAAWWYGGVLHNLDFLSLPTSNRAEGLREQLTQMAWAGEMEGWLTSPPSWHLVAEAAAAAEWEPALRDALDQKLEMSKPLPAPELAARTASRAAHSEPQANLLPAEFSARYQQQFVDRLWMGALGAVVAIYVACVAVYGVALEVKAYRLHAIEHQVVDLGPTFTNALQLKAQYQILKDRQDLKFAALDCWKKVAEFLPDGATVDTFGFSNGKKLTINGTSSPEERPAMLQFDGSLRKATVDGEMLFESNPKPGDFITFQFINGSSERWSCSFELKRSDVQ